MTQLQQEITLPTAMAQKLDVVRRRTLRVRIGTALVAAAGVLLAAMAVAMLVDWLATIYDFRWRALLTYSTWATAGITLGAWAIAAWRHTRRVDQVAAQVDREIPELEERWSTVTEVTTHGKSAEVHPAMFKQVATEAQSWTPRIAVDRVVPLDGLIRALLFLTAITTVLGIAVVIDSQRTTVLLQRFWQPYTAISATELTDLPGNVVVGRGESVEIDANLIGAPVTQASLLLQPSEGEAKTITLTPRGESQDRLAHRLRSVKEPLRYRFRAGDGQTPWFAIVVADRPQLANVRLKLTPPAYARKAPIVLHKLPRRVTVLEGSRVEVAMKPKQNLQSLRLKLGPDLTEQLIADQAGWYHWETTLAENLMFQPLLTEEHGLSNLRPPTCEIKVRPDKPPVVKILTPNSEIAVRPDDTIPVTFVASDDVGVHFAELVVYDESQKIDGKPTVFDRIPVPLGEQQGAVKVKATVKLDLSKYETTDGSELSFSIRVREDRGQLLLANQASGSGTMSSEPTHTSPVDSRVEPPKPSGKVQQAEVRAAENDLTAEAWTRAEDRTTSEKREQVPERSNALASTSGTPAAPNDKSSNASSASAKPSGRNSAAQPVNTDKPTKQAARSPQVAATEQQPPRSETTAAMKPEDTARDSEANPADNSRTTTTGRQSLSTESSSDHKSSAPPTKPNKQTTAATSPPSSESPPPETPSSGTPSAEAMKATNNPSPNSPAQQPGPASNARNQNRASDSKQSQNQPSSTPQGSTPSPENPMSKRGLDVEAARSSNSQRLRLKIDEWAGSFDGQQRQKLEVAIAPKLEALDRALEKAQQLSRSVLDVADAGTPWASKHDRDLQRADEQIGTAIKVVEGLEEETYDTPYAFIGLQLVDIKQAHIGPARQDFWKAMQTKDEARVDSTRHGWQHTTRARELLVLLTERFERTKIEYKLAESVENIKKMYQIFVKDSMALLRPNDDEGSRYGRKVVEFDLDEEYLKRVEEVNKMRSEMRAELARILADDPRLLRRFLDSERNQRKVLRNELDRLIERQSELNRETRAWTMAAEDQRPPLATILLGRHIESSQDLSIAAAELHDRFETWSPLGKESEDADFQATAKVLQEIATATRELSADGLRFIDEAKRAKIKADEGPSEAEESNDRSFDTEEVVEEISTNAQQLYEQFTQLEVLLRQIGSRQDRVDIAYFATNRLLETRRLIEQTSAWIRQLKQQQAGNYHRSAEVAQYRLAMQTDTMAGKLADLEQTMANLLQNDGDMLPKSIAEKARGLLAALDEQAAPNQLAAVYALRRNQLPRATSRQDSALEGLELAGKWYDEMVEASIKELDKLPVQDPIASLLDDPTLDELLARLEQEIPIEEALGIPSRPSNLRIMSDWLRPGGDNALMTGGNARMSIAQMRRQQQMRQQQLERAYRRAVARALKEAEAEDLVRNMPKLARETADWNRLASQLDDDLRQGRDKAPPERYRRAIEQYFRQVSGAEQKAE